MKKVLNIKIEDGICFLELSRLEKQNALNPELISELLNFFKKTEDSNYRAVVLSGKGKSFCSGADLIGLQDESIFTHEELNKLFSLLETMITLSIPVLTQIQGFTVGGGLGLIACSDVVIAETNSQFRFSETSLGLVPSIISPFILRKIGLSQAQFLMLTAQSFSAERAQEIGLVHFIGDSTECSEFVKKTINNFKKLDPQALFQTKKLLNSIYYRTLSDVKEDCVGIINEARKSDFFKKKAAELFKK